MPTRPLNSLVGLTALALAIPAAAQPLTTAFTYQGELAVSGAPAAGNYDIRFRLYSVLAGGAPLGSIVCSDNVPVVAGRFTVPLNFGSQFAGQQRFLEIEVRADTGLDCTNTTGFTLLAPRQNLTAAPHALFALNAGNANTAATATTADSASDSSRLNGESPLFYQDASNLTAGTLPGARLSGPYTNALTFSNAGNTFTGSGAGLTGLNASNLATGTVADVRVSSNVALLNSAQTFSAAKTFSAAPSFTAAGSPFSVTSTTLVTNLNADLLDGLHASAFLQSVPNPLVLSGTTGFTIQAQNSSTANGAAAMFGWETAATGNNYGVLGQTSSNNGRGVYGLANEATGQNQGVYGLTVSTQGVGTYGQANSATGFTSGVLGLSFSTDGKGVYGVANAASGTTYGVRGWAISPNGYGVYSEGNMHATGVISGNGSGLTGVNADLLDGLDSTAFLHSAPPIFLTGSNASHILRAENSSTTNFAAALVGVATSATGDTRGVHGQCTGTGGAGVLGYASSPTGQTRAVFALNESTSGIGLLTQATASTGFTYGVHATSNSTDGRGVFGNAAAATGTTIGVEGRSASTSGRGVYGQATAASGTIYGVLGEAINAGAAAGPQFGVFANGDMGASGNKPFRIDHPDDPANKYLLHYAAESPEVINFYSGKATLDAAGQAIVELPAYFARINKDPRYTLTPVGSPMPLLHVAEEIDEAALSAGAAAEPGEPAPVCSFRVAGGAPKAKICWRVEALRNDRWARRRGAPVEIDKQLLEKGTYQHPELYGQPPEKGMNYDATRPVAPERPTGAP